MIDTSTRFVWKYPLKPGVNKLETPAGIVRHVGIDPTGDQDGPTLWIEVAMEAASEVDEYAAFGTGHQIADGFDDYVGSTITPSGLVWHVYRRTGVDV